MRKAERARRGFRKLAGRDRCDPGDIVAGAGGGPYPCPAAVVGAVSKNGESGSNPARRAQLLDAFGIRHRWVQVLSVRPDGRGSSPETPEARRIIRPMIYLTQLVYVRPGEEETFREFEDVVLPLLVEYGGELLLRLRPTAESVVAASIEVPYELHFLRFESEEGLEGYGRDESRQRVLALKDRSLRATLVVKGTVAGSGSAPAEKPGAA